MRTKNHLITVALILISANLSIAQTAYIACSGNGKVKVIDTVNDSLITTIQLQYGLYGVATSPDGNRVYILNNLLNELSIISTATNTVIATLPTAIGPTDIIVSPDNSKAYFIVGLHIYVVDANTNTITNTITPVSGSEGIAISPDGTKLYLACNGTPTFSIKVVSTSSNSVINTTSIASKPYELRVSPDGSKLYIANKDDNSIMVMNTATHTILNTIALGHSPAGMCLNSTGTKLYVTNGLNGTLTIINTANYSLSSTPSSVGNAPWGISITPNDEKLYVTNNPGNSFADVNALTNTLTTLIPIGTGLSTADPICMGNFISTHAQPTGIEDYQNECININVFPNPTTGQFTVILPTDCAEITVSDMLGQQIIKTQTRQKITNLQLDDNGVYLVYFTTKQGTTTRKLIVKR